jgi:small GTP-binding protein
VDTKTEVYPRRVTAVFKVMFVGDTQSGKTSIIECWSQNVFNKDVKQTIGVEFTSKFVTIKDQNVQLQVWDTAGAERFRVSGSASAFFKGSDAFVLCVNGGFVLDSASIKGVIDEAKVWAPDARFYVAITKNDLKLHDDFKDRKRLRENLKIAASALANLSDDEIVFCSAKADENINELFEKIAIGMVNENTVEDDQAAAPLTLPAGIKISPELTTAFEQLKNTLASNRGNAVITQATQTLINNTVGQLKAGESFEQVVFDNAVKKYEEEVTNLSGKQKVFIAAMAFLGALVGFVAGVVAGAAISGLNPVAAVLAGAQGAIVGGSVGAVLGGGIAFSLARFGVFKQDPVKAEADEFLQHVVALKTLLI